MAVYRVTIGGGTRWQGPPSPSALVPVPGRSACAMRSSNCCREQGGQGCISSKILTNTNKLTRAPTQQPLTVSHFSQTRLTSHEQLVLHGRSSLGSPSPASVCGLGNGHGLQLESSIGLSSGSTFSTFTSSSTLLQSSSFLSNSLAFYTTASTTSATSESRGHNFSSAYKHRLC